MTVSLNFDPERLPVAAARRRWHGHVVALFAPARADLHWFSAALVRPATPDPAKALVQTNYLADDCLRGNWGVRSLSSKESMDCLDFSSNPSHWLGPVWISVNYFVWQGLKDFGFTDETGKLADPTLQRLSTVLARNGSLNEYYHPDTGMALSRKGFMNWNRLVLEIM
jgi:putative isomerase